VLADRELFGGPNVVTVGGMSGGPHGFTIAGTWIGPANHPVVAAWRSGDGTHWARDDTDPALAGRPGETPLGYGVADGPAGLLLVGAAEEPAAGHEDGALWYSTGGSTWVRVGADDPSLTGADQTVVATVQPLGGGWLSGGSRTTGGRTTPTVWAVTTRPAVAVRATSLPVAAGVRSALVTAVAVTATAALAAGVADGRAALWWAPVHAGGLGAWQALSPPPLGAAASVRSGLVAAARGWVLVAFSGTALGTSGASGEQNCDRGAPSARRSTDCQQAGPSALWRARFPATGSG
jgi:hypothetical protein